MTIVAISGKNKVYLTNIIASELYGCMGFVEKDNKVIIFFNDFEMEE